MSRFTPRQSLPYEFSLEISYYFDNDLHFDWTGSEITKKMNSTKSIQWERPYSEGQMPYWSEKSFYSK
ncbi:hypothetical protein EUGRSUZ_H02031 [Eucalyptus grandis]|uniref:Uncharacterized protein n=2 Tax=Eucalyptus grandis TaxID=71139 RepID=A0ACC3JRJ3_EUCGR|nr:hypothetical protein EUGRSUZ_H02031 [Eucalyptus grandis]